MLPGFLKLLLSTLDPAIREALLAELGYAPARFAEARRRRGLIEITTRNLESGLVAVELIRNQITDACHNLDRDNWSGAATDNQIKYLAVGDGNSAPTSGQTQLDNERYRQQITAYTAGGTGILTSTCLVGPGAALFHWKELAWFAGAAASVGVNTGVMVARVLYDHDHSASAESVQVARQDTGS